MEYSSATCHLLCRSNDSYDWIIGDIPAADSQWAVIVHLQPYTQYQFQLVMYNETVLRSGWITTDMDGMIVAHIFCCLRPDSVS